MKYKIFFLPAARKDILALPHDIQKKIDRKILALVDNPRPHGFKLLHGDSRFYRIRVGDYRIVYSIEDKEITIIIIRIRHRKEVYR